MTREAVLHDGRVLEFPDETTDEVVQRTVRRELGLPEEDRAQPGSASYIAQGAPAALESLGRMGLGMAGSAAGALVGGVEAGVEALRGEGGSGADIIRQRMAAGAEQMTPSNTMFAPTKSFDEALAGGFEAVREHLGSSAELAETARGSLAQRIAPQGMQDLVGPKPEAARTLGEFSFDAPAAVAPLSLALRGVKPRPRPTPDPTPTTTAQPRTPGEIYKEHVDATEKPADRSGAELDAALRSQLEADAQSFGAEPLSERMRVQKAFEEAIAKARQEPVTPGEPTPTPEPTRPLPPRGETGAVGHLDRLSSLERDLIKYQEELRDATRREEKDTVKYFKEAIEEVKDTMADLKAKYEEQPPIDPFKGPGKRQAGAVGDLSNVPIEQRLRYRYRILDTQTGHVVSEAFNKHRARNKANKLDLEYGAVRYRVEEYITDPITGLRGPGRRQMGAVGDLSSREIRDQLTKAEDRLGKLADEHRSRIRPSDLLIPELEEAQRTVRRLSAAYNAAFEREMATILRGPGRSQAGMFDPSAFRARKQAGDKQTEFEREQKIPAGAGLSLPDTEGPLLDRVVETLAQGEAMNLKKGTPYKVELPNDIGSWLSKYFITPEHLTKLYADNPLVKTVIDRVKAIDQLYAALSENLLEGAQLDPNRGVGRSFIPGKPFKSVLTGVRRKSGQGLKSLLDHLNKNEVEQFFKARLQFDNAEILREQKLHWPTEDMLRKAGYSDKVAKAYLEDAQYMDIIYDLVNKAREKSGKKPIPFLPGYFPHTYKGNVGIKILRQVQDKVGNVKDVTVGYTRTSGSEKAINKVMNDLMADIQKGLQDAGQTNIKLRAEQARTDKVGSMAELMDAFESVSEVYSGASHPLMKLVKKVLDNRVASMEQQFLASSLHRSGVKGWLGETGVTTKNLRHIARKREAYVDNAIKYARSQEILKTMNEIPAPVWAEVSKKLPNTADFVEKFVDVARERVPFSTMDRFALDAVDSLFQGRIGYRAPLTGLNRLRSFFSWKDLAWSSAYHTANLLQPTMYSPAALMREFNRIGKGDPHTAYAKGEAEFWSPTLETKRAMEYAAKNKVINPKLMEAVDLEVGRHKQIGETTFESKVKSHAWDAATGAQASKVNEMSGRARVYLQGYYYYKSVGMTAIQSMRAAGKFTDDVMVDYGKVGQNLWLSNNPMGQIAGKLVAPYAQFGFSHWGHVALALQAIKKSPASVAAYGPVIELATAGVLVGGLRGMIGIAEAALIYDMLNKAYNQLTGDDTKWPNLKTLMVKAGLDDWAMFGALSAATKNVPGMERGMDLGGTAASPEISSSVNLRTVEGTLQTFADLWPMMAKLFRSDQMTDGEKLSAIKAATPKFMHGIWNMAFGTEGVRPDPRNRMVGSVKETQSDKDIGVFTGGRQSIAQQREDVVRRDLVTSQLQRNESKSKLVEIAADQLANREEISAEVKRKAIELGYKPADFMDQVRKLARDRRRTHIERMLRKKEMTRNLQLQRRRFEEMRDDLEDYPR